MLARLKFWLSRLERALIFRECFKSASLQQVVLSSGTSVPKAGLP